MTEPVLVPGLVALVDPVTGRFSDSLAPPSVAANTATAAAAATAAASAKTAAETAQTAAQAAKVAAETAAATVVAVNADAVTVDNLGQATTLGKALVKAADANAAQTAIGASTVGKALVTATDAPSARTTLSAVGKGDLVYNVRDYGAVGDGTTDDTTAINAACTAAAAAGAVVFGRGTFKTTSTVTILGPCDFTHATFNYANATGISVQVGTTATRIEQLSFRLPKTLNTIKGVGGGWGAVAGSTGIRVTNIYSSEITVPFIRNFETGLHEHASGSNGNVYNTYYLGHLENNKVNQLIQKGDSSAWVNQNTHIGGRVSHRGSEGLTPQTGVVHVKIADNLNNENNVWIGTSLESNGTVDYHIDCAGQLNSFQFCRFEQDTAAYRRVIWRAGSAGNKIFGGMSYDSITYVTETGAKNFGSATPVAMYPTASRPASLGAGGLLGDTTLGRLVWSPDGTVVKTVALQDDIVSQLSGSGSPEGVVTAAVGTVYTRTDAGLRTNLCTYPLSDTVSATTGWVRAGGSSITAGPGYIRNTLLVNADGTASRNLRTTDGVQAVTPSTPYVFQAQARSSVAMAMNVYVRFYTSGLVQTGSTVPGAAITPGSTFTTLPAVNALAPADAAWVTITINADITTPNVAGDTMDVRHVIYENDTVVRPYFDGSTAAGGGITYAWFGTAQVSKSVATYSVRPVSYVKTGTGNTGWVPLAPAGSISVPAAATDLTTTQALVNSMRTALITSGLLT